MKLLKIIFISLILLSFMTFGTVTPIYAQSPTPTASPTPEVSQPQGMIGPPVPQLQQQDSRQQMQQQGQKGDVKSAFSDENGPDSIGDAPGSQTAGAIKIFVTVIALTISGVVGWMAIKSNAKVDADTKIEDNPEKSL